MEEKLGTSNGKRSISIQGRVFTIEDLVFLTFPFRGTSTERNTN